MKIQKLELEAFRGATQPFTLEFDPAKPITMVFGENGSGKSSIADALICLCTNAKGSLDDKSGTDDSFLVAADCQPAELRLQLHTDQGAFSASYQSKKIVRAPQSGQPRLRHLRRSSVVALSTAAPATRYEKLAEYFDLSAVVKSEDNLRAHVKSLQAESESNIRTLAELQRLLEEIWRNEGSPSGNWQVWAELETQKNHSAENERLQKLRRLLDAGQRSVQTAERLRSIREQGRQIAEKRQAAEAQLAALQTSARFDPALLPLLQQARNFVSAHADHPACPVCSQSIVGPDLLAQLDERLQSMADLRQASDAAESLNTEHKGLQARWKAVFEEVAADLAACTQAANWHECPSAIAKCLAELNADAPAARQQAEQFEQMQNRFSDLLNGLNINIEAISKTIDQHRLIRSNWEAVLDNRRSVVQNQHRLDAAKQALEIVETTRKKFIDAELTAISSAVDALYQALHPGEQLGDIRLFLKEKGKNSLEITGRFHHHTGITPQSVYSESHLDTLALCIFFALARRYGGQQTILLLDDVLSACDEAHLDRFISLLHDQAPHFAHIFLTTHYRPWRDRYRQQRAPQNEIHLVELMPWSPQRGIHSQNGRNDLQELRHALDPATHFDRQSIANKAGTLLENMLDHLALRYARPLPYRARREYALRELLDCFSTKLSAALRVEHFGRDAQGRVDTTQPLQTQALQPLLDTLKTLSMVRNQVGAHFNVSGSTISDSDVRLFGASVLALADCLICPESGGFPDRDKSGSWLETRSGLVRLHPLQPPA